MKLCRFARLIREAIADLASPCPLLNFTAFADYFGNAVTRKFGKKYAGPPFFDPYFDDVTIFLAIWSLEEIGATGDKVSGLLYIGTWCKRIYECLSEVF